MDQGPLLARSTPAAEGIDGRGVAALLDRLDERSIECHSLMVVRHGRVVAEGWWAPYSASRRHLLYSLTKTFTSVAVGIAIGDGRLTLDSRLGDVLPSYDSDLTVEHLLTMTAGHADDSLASAWSMVPGDLVEGFLRVPFPYPAGTRHAYDNATTFVLARMVERATGQDLPSFLEERLFRPMGITGAEWDRVASGATFGFHGLHLTTEAVVAFGELLLRDGRWRDRQLIPRDWLRRATTARIETLQFEDGSREPNCLQGYGYQIWMSRHGFRGDGAFGQFCLVVPSHDLVVAMTSATMDTAGALDAVWECLLPAIEPPAALVLPPSSASSFVVEPSSVALVVAESSSVPSVVVEDDLSLSERLRRLSLPMVDGDHRPDRSARATIPSHDTPVSLEPRPDGWLLRLGPSLEIEVGHRTWHESAPLGRPLVATGAWQDDLFVADLYVITGPHHLRVTIDGPVASAAWNLEPLTGPSLLNQLREPLMTRPDVS